MKSFLSRTWPIYAIGSVLFMALCPYIGWYAIANLAVAIMVLYAIHQAKKRRQRLEDNVDVLRKMSRKQKEAFVSLDDKEVRNIAASSRIMPYMCFGCVLLNGYTFWYNMNGQKSVALVPGIPKEAALWLLIVGMALGVILYFAFCFRMNELMALPEDIVAMNDGKSASSLLRKKEDRMRLNTQNGSKKPKQSK